VRWAAGPARSPARGRGDPEQARPTPGRQGWGAVAAPPSEGRPGGRRPGQATSEIRELQINLAAMAVSLAISCAIATR
jgi:hypothetical protein